MSNYKDLVINTILMSVLLICHFAIAEVPQMITYQGRIANETGLVNGTIGLAFQLYTNETAIIGESLIYEDSNTVTVSDGLYAAVVGDTTTTGKLLEAVTLYSNLFVELVVDGQHLSPRRQLLAMPYALSAIENDPVAMKNALLKNEASIMLTNGVYQPFTDLIEAVSEVGTNTGVLLLADGVYPVTNNLVISESIDLHIENGAVIDTAEGKSLTIAGSIDAGIYQIFSGNGDVFYTGSRTPYVYPQWFGAEVNDSVDDASYINRCVNYLSKKSNLVQGEIRFSSGEYVIDSVRPTHYGWIDAGVEASWTTNLWFRGYPHATIVPKHCTEDSRWSFFMFTFANNIKVSDLTFNLHALPDPYTTTWEGLRISGIKGFQAIDNNWINTPEVPNDAAAIISGVTIEDILIRGNRFDDWKGGEPFLAMGPVYDCIIEQNLFYTQHGDVISFWSWGEGYDPDEVSSNIVVRNNYIGETFLFFNRINNLTFSDNIVHANVAFGRPDHTNRPTRIVNAIIANNIFYRGFHLNSTWTTEHNTNDFSRIENVMIEGNMFNFEYSPYHRTFGMARKAGLYRNIVVSDNVFREHIAPEHSNTTCYVAVANLGGPQDYTGVFDIHVENLLFNRNTIIVDSEATAPQNYYLWINSSNSSGIVIANNIMQGGPVAPYEGVILKGGSNITFIDNIVEQGGIDDKSTGIRRGNIIGTNAWMESDIRYVQQTGDDMSGSLSVSNNIHLNGKQYFGNHGSLEAMDGNLYWISSEGVTNQLN